MALDTLSKAIGDTIDLSVGDIIAKFGGDKRAIALAAQKGEIDPTKAVMAGMAVDRVVASAAQPQNTTVAEDVLAQRPAGIGAMAPQGPQMGQPQMGQPQMPQRPGQGLNQVPVPQRGFAGGGIVGFQAGGSSASLITALERVLAKAKQSDPNLNVDYVRRSVLSAPPEKQQQLVQSLIERVALDQTPAAAPPSFTQALSQREVDPRVMGAMQRSQGLTADEMATPSPLTKEAAGLAAVAKRDATQADTGAQYGARPGVKDFTGSEVYAGIAQRAGNIYEGGVNPFTGAADIARSGMDSFRNTFGPKAKMGDEGIIEPSATDFLGQGVPTQRQVDPFSATERFTGSTTQTDPGFVPQDQTPSAAMLKQAAEDEAKKAEAKPKPTEEKPAAEEDEAKKPKSYDDYLTEVMNRMGTSTVGSKMRDEIEKDRKSRKEAGREAMWMRVVEAGLGIMGGESPYALVNIGKGATNALRGYADDLREQKKLDREDRKILLDLEKAERAEQRDNFKLAAEMREKALDRMSAKERSEIAARASMYAADKSLEAASMLKPGPAITSRLKLAEAVDAQLVMNQEYQKLRKQNPAAAEAFRKQIIDARANEIGLNQMPGLNLGAWGQLTTVPGAK